jgi:hypothetical protein
LHTKYASCCGLLLRTLLFAGFSILLAACGGGDLVDYSSQTDVGKPDVGQWYPYRSTDGGEWYPYVGANSVGSLPETNSQRAATGLIGQAPGEPPLATAEGRSAQAHSINRGNLLSSIGPSDAPSVTFQETSVSAPACHVELPGEKLRFIVVGGTTATWQDLVNGARQIITCLEHERRRTVQWYASISLQGDERVAVVNVVAVGEGVAASSGGLESEDRKRALCPGGTAAAYGELLQQIYAYDNETEALILGMPSGTTSGALADKRAQLQAEESLLTEAESDVRAAARMAIRNKRNSGLQECIDRQKL